MSVRHGPRVCNCIGKLVSLGPAFLQSITSQAQLQYACHSTPPDGAHALRARTPSCTRHRLVCRSRDRAAHARQSMPTRNVNSYHT